METNIINIMSTDLECIFFKSVDDFPGFNKLGKSRNLIARVFNSIFNIHKKINTKTHDIDGINTIDLYNYLSINFNFLIEELVNKYENDKSNAFINYVYKKFNKFNKIQTDSKKIIDSIESGAEIPDLTENIIIEELEKNLFCESSTISGIIEPNCSILLKNTDKISRFKFKHPIDDNIDDIYWLNLLSKYEIEFDYKINIKEFNIIKDKHSKIKLYDKINIKINYPINKIHDIVNPLNITNSIKYLENTNMFMSNMIYNIKHNVLQFVGYEPVLNDSAIIITDKFGFQKSINPEQNNTFYINIKDRHYAIYKKDNNYEFMIYEFIDYEKRKSLVSSKNIIINSLKKLKHEISYKKTITNILFKKYKYLKMFLLHFLNIDIDIENFDKQYNDIINIIPNDIKINNLFVETNILYHNNIGYKNTILYIDKIVRYYDDDGYICRYSMLGLYRIINRTKNMIWDNDLSNNDILIVNKLYEQFNN